MAARDRDVEHVGLEFHADAVPDFKSVLQHQELGFGVDGGALPGFADPRPADLHPMVGRIDIAEARGAHHLIGGLLDRDKGQGDAQFLSVERGAHVRPHLFRRIDLIRRQLPQIRILPD